MAKRTIELTTERMEEGHLAESKPRVVRVRLVGGEARLDVLGRYWPAPRWMLALDGVRVRTLALALLALAGAAWALARLLGAKR